MPTKAIQQFKAWSFSRLSDWEKCPAYAKYKHLDKLPVPQGPALERGEKIHKLAEQYATGLLKKIPDELKLFRKEFSALRKIKRQLSTEHQIAVDKNWMLTDWFGPEAWCRVVLDLVWLDTSKKTLTIWDWKTGKINPAQASQLDLYALVGFVFGGEKIEHVRTAFQYLDQGESVPYACQRAEVPAQKKKWKDRAAPMLSDTKFKPTPSSMACRFCLFSKGNKGPCKY
jgi:hypothetical protein